jgi:hypothetical protein
MCLATQSRLHHRYYWQLHKMSGLPGIDIAGIVKANKGQNVSDYISSHFLLRLSRRSLGTTRKVSVSLMGISLPPFSIFSLSPCRDVVRGLY